jgi:LPXTG-motif cell wall-anchored protein
VDTGVSGSSEDSRALLGTNGHHGDWQYAEQSINIPVTAQYRSWIRNNTALIAGGLGGIGTMAGGGYLLQRRKKSTKQSEENTPD